MNLYIIEIESLKDRGCGRKLAVHAEDDQAARDLVHKRYGANAWTIASLHERAGPAAITFEESEWE